MRDFRRIRKNRARKEALTVLAFACVFALAFISIIFVDSQVGMAIIKEFTQ